MSQRSSQSPPAEGTPMQGIVTDAAHTADDLFDLAAPPLQQPLVARLVPLQDGLPTLDLHQDTGTLVVGRGKNIAEEHRITLSDKLSAQHCEFIVDAVTLRVEMRDTSTNGVFLNGSRVEKGMPVALQNGDRVALTRLPDTGSRAVSALDKDVDTPSKSLVEYVFQRLQEETTTTRMKVELTCSICQSIFHRPCSVLPCLHAFCAGCISAWVTQHHSHSCPECRQTITDVRPTHRLQSCAENFLIAHPDGRRSAEELALLDAADVVPVSGLNMGKRPRDDELAPDDDRDSEESSEDIDGGVGDGAPVLLRHWSLTYSNTVPLAGGHCSECDASNPVDGFQCPAGGPHLRCSACHDCFPERPLCGRPQRCHVCNAAFCHLYRQGGCSAHSDSQPFQRFRDYAPMNALPPQTFGGNTIEQSILSTYLAAHEILVKDVWAVTLSKFEAGEWIPDMVLVNGPMQVDAAVCQSCAAAVFAALLFHYRRSIDPDELPDSVTQRPHCWYGKECRTQFNKLQHAQNFNHVCYQEKRKE